MRPIALSVSHTPWIAARVDSMARLQGALGVVEGKPMPEGVAAFYVEKERAPNWHWSLNQWVWGAAQQAMDFVALNDDVVPAPVFFPALQAMMAVWPDAIIDLTCVHPGARRVAREGKRAYTTLDGLVGNGYRIPTPVLVEMLAWRRDYLYHDAIEWTHEDSLIDIFALCTGRKIVHPVPTIIEHDEDVRSSYGNDNHAYRSPAVTWRDLDILGAAVEDMTSPDYWREGGDVPHFGRQYGKTHWAAKRLVKGFTMEQFRAADRAKCPPAYARFFTRA